MTRPRVSDSSSAAVPVDPMTELVTAVLVARQTPELTTEDVEGSLSELRHLLEGLGIPVASQFVQKRGPAALEVLGKGKLQEVAAELARIQEGPPAATPLVVVDEALSPGQLRMLNKQLDVEVIDRPDVILRVFARRARTRTAQLEIELARLTYQAPRVRDVRNLNFRTGGGGGRGERGHTNVELRKQDIRARITKLETELAALRPLEQRQRERRQELPTVALVGYTNAGKSSLMRGLTGSDVLVEDKLFATLGTTVRAISPSTMPRILVADTVGFIKNLPTELIASFRATLDEAREADLLLLVLDAADPRWPEHLRVTRDTLDALGPGVPRSLLIFNKIDRVSPDQLAELVRAHPEAVTMNALDPEDLRHLRQRLIEFFEGRMVEDVLPVPVTDGRLHAEIRAEARILEERLDDGGTILHLRVRALPPALERWRAAV
jgi:GTP-binding protein HflX